MASPLRPPSDAEDKLRDIRSVTDAALSYLDADDLLAELLGRVKEILDADTVAVLLLESSGRQLIATAASGLEEEVRQGVRIPVGGGFAGRIAAERRPVILEHVDHTNVLNPILLEKGIQSLVGVPLLVHGAVTGVLHVGTVHNRVFTAEDAALLQLAADRAALAVQSLRSREDRAATAALQRSLLPSALPVIGGVEIAARYVPGDGSVGGDWYDVFRLPWGELGVVVGDVAGSGLGGAVVMGRMRSALARTRWSSMIRRSSCASWIRNAVFRGRGHGHRVLRRSRPGLGAGADIGGGPFPPVVAAPGGRGVLAEIAVDAPIGVADASDRQVTTLALVPGAVLCFFTDGLGERRNKPLDDGIALLCETVSPGPPETVCLSVMRALVGSEHPGDDIALLVLRWQREAPS